MNRRRLLQGTAASIAAGFLFPAGEAEAADGTTDYPGAHWVPASTSNYTASTRPSAYPIDYVVIHITQETWSNTIDIFQNPAKKV
ncbi:N-acetylmuramoyl-L-alanine amidase, partial [Streptomyces sp. NPDC089922]